MNTPTPESLAAITKNLAAITERVDDFIEALSEHFISADAVNALALEINKLLTNQQNGMNILALSVCLADVLSEMDAEHRGIALAGVCKLVLNASKEEAAP
jgi:hypothetical protein